METRSAWFMRIGLTLAALLMIEGGLKTDAAGISLVVILYLVQRFIKPNADGSIPVRGAD